MTDPGTDAYAQDMTNQRHCRNTADHAAHRFYPSGVADPIDGQERRCPGRHTGHGFETTAPIAHPMDTDPFAGTDSIWD